MRYQLPAGFRRKARVSGLWRPGKQAHPPAATRPPDAPAGAQPAGSYPGADTGGREGPSGGDTALVLINNGHPSHAALLRLGRPIAVPPRQGIEVLAEIFQMAAAGDHDLVATLNAQDDIAKDIKYFIDGLATREVQ